MPLIINLFHKIKISKTERITIKFLYLKNMKIVTINYSCGWKGKIFKYMSKFYPTSEFEWESNTSLVLFIGVNKSEGHDVVSAGGERRNKAHEWELEDISLIIVLSKIGGLFVQHSSIEFNSNINSLVVHCFGHSSSLNGDKSTTLIVSLMFLLGIWSRVKLSTLQGLSPQSIQG